MRLETVCSLEQGRLAPFCIAVRSIRTNYPLRRVFCFCAVAKEVDRANENWRLI